MNTITERAYAKVNLSLDVLQKRRDGYHDLRMIMQTVSLCDELTLTPTEEPVFRARCNLRYLPNNENNLATMAAKAYYRAVNREGGMVVDLVKNIPVGAGLGGGSADAAAVLRALGREGLLREDELLSLALQCGSDVPFCLRGGTQLAESRGERLRALPALPACFIVLCKPAVSIATRAVFMKLKASALRHHPDTDGIIQALSEGSLVNVARRMYNALEDSVSAEYKDIAAIHAMMLALGAAGVVMSGTGSAVIGVFEEQSDAAQAEKHLAAFYPETYLTQPVSAFL